MLLLLFGGFALLGPSARPASAQIGLMYDSTDISLQRACEPLLISDALNFIYYPPEALPAMQQDVRSGVLHCAYYVDAQNDLPITVYENEGTFLTSVTDELIFGAWFETQLPQVTLTIAQELGLKDQQHIVADMQRLQAQGIPLTPQVTLNTAAAPPSANSSALTPLLYAVLISLFLLCCAFSAILAPSHERELIALLQLRCPARPWLPAAACMLAQVALFAVLPTLCEGLLLLLGIQTGYTPIARVTLIVVLALLAALIVPIISRLRPNAVLLLAIILWTAVAIVFSGAVIPPEAFGSFSGLKYLSPPWYLLQLMTALS